MWLKSVGLGFTSEDIEGENPGFAFLRREALEENWARGKRTLAIVDTRVVVSRRQAFWQDPFDVQIRLNSGVT